jgi:hypothetical protein
MAETIEELKEKLLVYESNGAAKLFYSLNRKMNEMADLMNKTSLKTLNIEDPKDKTFERLKAIWNDAESIGAAAKSLGELAGVTGDENKDVARKPFNTQIAEKRY